MSLSPSAAGTTCHLYDHYMTNYPCLHMLFWTMDYKRANYQFDKSVLVKNMCKSKYKERVIFIINVSENDRKLSGDAGIKTPYCESIYYLNTETKANIFFQLFIK